MKFSYLKELNSLANVCHSNNEGKAMFERKFKYRLHVENADLGEVELINPIAIGEAVKVGNKSYRITDIWHSKTGSIAYVEIID
uniref:Uncharacterized protein n=2 Tax=Vibrionaceae TaxID=641 RepID=A0A0H3ZST3_VIBSP|nr:hypothetical protein [Vibrio splendidus]AKN40571.1 hypothetical protein [Enterovibrio norvegicus]